MQGQAVHRFPERRDPARRAGAQPLQQPPSRVERSARRGLEPLERHGIAAPGQHLEHRRRQVHARHLGLAARPQHVALVPQPHDAPGARSPRPPSALRRRVRGDPLELQPVEPARRVIAQHLVLTGVDHVRHALHGERRLRDVRGQDHLALRARRERRVLLLARERAVERQHARPLERAELRLRPANLGGARQEAEQVAAWTAQDLAHRGGDACPRLVAQLDRVRARAGFDHGAVPQEAGDRPRLERRRHHHEPQVVARPPRLPREGEREVGVEAPLVELVEHDRAEPGEQRVRLQSARQHAFRSHEHSRLRREALLEADLVTDLAAQLGARLIRNAARNRACRDAAGLQHEHRPVPGQRRRHARGLARTGRRHEHEGAGRAQRREDPGDVRVDRKLGPPRRHRRSSARPRV